MELFRQTFTIMIVGMSLVFFFLFIVIQFMNLIAFMVRRYEAKMATLTAESDQDNVARRRLAAAIAAATEPHHEKN